MDPMNVLVFAIAALVMVLYVFFWYILPVLWRYLLRPLGKLAYFLLLVLLGISFFAIFFVGKQLGIPQDVQIMMALFSAVISGIKWASKRV